MKMIVRKQLKEQPAGCSLRGKYKKMCQPYLGLDKIPSLLKRRFRGVYENLQQD